MWFKNLQVYKFEDSADFNFDSAVIEENLRENEFKPCPSIMAISRGWVSPLSVNDQSPLVHEAFGFLLITLQTEEKILPSSVVRERLFKRVSEIELAHDRKLSSKEKLSLKDDIYSEMVVKAFSKTSKISAFIDPKNRLIIIDAPTRSKAEDFCSVLRSSLGTLPIASPITNSPAVILTRWLRTAKLPKDFSFGEKCVLRSIDDTGSLSCDRQDIVSENINNFLENGAIVKSLQLQFLNYLRFVIKEDLSITSVKFMDATHNIASESRSDNIQQELDAVFVIMVKVVTELLKSLLPNFQGKE